MRLTKWIACLCLLLTVWSAGAFVAHHHSDSNDSACAVCVAALSSSPTATALPPVDTLAVVSTFKAEPVSAAKQRLIAFALTVRPPPQA